MNYIGSKLSLLSFIEESIEQIAGDVKNKVFCDLFAGTGVVGLHYKKKDCKIIANDLQYYSYVLNKHLIGNHKVLLFEGLLKEIPDLKSIQNEERKNIVCDFLNCLNGKEGFIYKNYCPNENNDRLYFTPENGKKCDAIRDKIDEWFKESKINENEYFFLLASLLESIDKKANTASVYGAYLKEFKNSAKQSIVLNPLPIYENDYNHNIYNLDANTLIKDISCDILYLDPPYNNRQYAPNYHILETIAKNDKPLIMGKTGLRDYSKQKSKYCQKSKVKEEFADLIENAKAKYIFLSYNNEGLLNFDDIKEVLSRKGKYGYFEKKHNRFKSDDKRFNLTDYTIEYLHYVIVGSSTK